MSTDVPSLSSAMPHLSTPALFRLLLWVHWRSFLARWRKTRRESPLLLIVLGLFVVSYLSVGYWLFFTGLNFLHEFQVVGSLLSQRILFLIFAFFFAMLVFSNLIIGYSTLFKNRETQWLMALPLTHRDVYRWKFLEALLVSSWALIFLSAPMMIAFGRVHAVAPHFYAQIALVYLPFVVIPALLGSWIIVFLVRILARRGLKKGVFVLAGAAVLLLIFAIKPVSNTEATAQHEILSFGQLLRHTRLSVNPYLPSAWLAQSVLAWSDGLVQRGFFFFLLLLSNALMGLLIGFEVVGRCFFGSWTAALSSRAERYQRHAEAKRQREYRPSLLERGTNLLRLFSPPISALVLKDVRLFWRDPAQWIQFMIFFGLLCIYVLNLRNVDLDFQNPFWETMISYLNLAASALTLSTLTTRFVFPQFSLEGRRLWIIGLAPIGLHRVLWQKFAMSALTSMSVTVVLMVVSSVMLHLDREKVFFFGGSIAAMSAALSGLAVGLGALFPNFKEDNPSKIVSGFGGTLCLVVSFIYIALFVALAALPDVRRVTNVDLPIPDEAAHGLALVLSGAVLFIPLAIAIRRVKNLEF
jgi:ABC-2 type transport system permease protein